MTRTPQPQTSRLFWLSRMYPKRLSLPSRSEYAEGPAMSPERRWKARRGIVRKATGGALRGAAGYCLGGN